MCPARSRQEVHPPALDAYHVNSKIWRAIAGANFRIPSINSIVHYFPQGHIEHASSPLQYLNPLIIYRPIIPCHVSAMEYLADPITDEVYVKISLVPIVNDNNGSDRFTNSMEAPNEETALSFSKVLTPSDANNGGGFSVPRQCADTIFPPLNFAVDRPFHTLKVTDVLGTEWDFRHIFRGTPKRHLLTTGWSKFVNNKNLIADDSVVFIKDSNGALFVGVRRAFKTPKLIVVDSSMWDPKKKDEREKHVESHRAKKGTFSRNGKGRLSANEVSDAIELAVQNKPFEVVYYPRLGWADFVVKAEDVEKSWNVEWTSGMRVKMATEIEATSKTTWHQGTITSIVPPDNGLWMGSPWRKLQVLWDEPEVMHTAERVSPWEVEPVTFAIPHNVAFPPAKRFRAAQNFGVATVREGDPFFSILDLGNPTMGHFNQSLLNYNIVPAAMQGARQDLSSLSNFEIGNHHPYIGNTFGNMVPKMRTLMPTEPNADNCQSNGLSPKSKSSLHATGTEFAGTRGCNLTRPGVKSIRLFGKVIEVEQPAESECTGDEGNNGWKETEGVDQ